MHPQKDALVRLLADDDEQTVRLVKEQLARHTPTYLDDLRDLAECAHPTVALHARDVLGEVMQKGARDQFEQLCTAFKENADIEDSHWLLSASLLRGLEITPYRQRLDAWGAELQRRLRRSSNEQTCVEIMTDFIVGELTFTGNADDYYNEQNSLLPCVLDSRQGIPLSLALVYMFIGRRAGVTIYGINLPGHFLARHGDILFDPFHRGRIMTQRDCEEILHRQNKSLEEWHLGTATSRQILTRSLANLLYIYHQKGNTSLYQRLKHWSHLLCRRS